MGHLPTGAVLYDSFQTTTYPPGVSRGNPPPTALCAAGYPRGGWRIGSTRYMTDAGGNHMAQERILYDGFGNQAYRTGENTRPGDFQVAGRWGYQTEYAFGAEPGVRHAGRGPAAGSHRPCLTPE